MRKALALLTAIALALVTAGPSLALESPQTRVFSSQRHAGGLDHVTILLEVGGDLKEKVEGKVKSVPMSVVCNLEYDEKTLELRAGPSGRARSVAAYDTAAAVIKMGEEVVKPSLRPERAMVVAQIDPEATTLFSPGGPLLREELEVIAALGNSLQLDRLLPDKPVAPGDSWKHADQLLAGLLNLDEVRENDVQSVLKEVTDTLARFEMSGKVAGTVNDVSTAIVLKAKYRFDLRTQRIDWMGLVLQEERGISQVAAGFDASARFQIRVVPKETNPSLSDAALAGLTLEANAAATQLEHRLPEAGCRLTHDRRWHLVGNQRELAVFKLLDHGDVIAQCNMTPLANRSPAELPSLEAFQKDVRRALGENFGEFAQAGQSADKAEHRIYKVVVEGKVSDVPIQWSYYLVADREGHQAAFAFTIQQKLVERLAEADEQLVHAVSFSEAK